MALNYIFCDDEEILRVNRQFLDHDYYTDIITFDDCIGRMLRGVSSAMYYDGGYEMTSVTLYYSTSSWKLPTAFVVERRDGE